MKAELWTAEEVNKQIRKVGLISSVRVNSADSAIFCAENVLAGGIPIVEITSSVPESDEVIRELTLRFPKLIVGAEVVTGLEQALRKLESGAVFLTGPGFDPEVAGYCVENEIVVIPGALSPTEVMLAHKLGSDFVKVFPCTDVGGPRYIHALKAALADVPLIAAGGVTQSTAVDFIRMGATALGVGEDLIPRQAIRFKEGSWIRELAARFVQFVQQARGENT